MIFNRDKPGDTQQPQAAKPQTTQPPATPPKPEQTAKPAEPPRPAVTATPIPTPTKAGAIMASVISKALKITGELESTEDIQIDGQIEGDVRGVGVKIGQNAKVKGTVYGDEVELAGTVEGKIEAKKVLLAGTARITGDIWHQDIKVESGAYINGNLKPELGKSDTKSAPKPAATTTTSTTTGNVSSLTGTTGAPHH
jgi:cytoskeletal protein CcmA (bactofilin family)